MYDYNQTNRKLKARIVEHFGTQRLFAFKMREDESYVSKVIKGFRLPNPRKQELWATALKSEIEEIFPAEVARRSYS